MSYFYFFKSEPMCQWLYNEIVNVYPAYLKDPIEYKGKKVWFYTIREWVSGSGRGVKDDWCREHPFNIVDTVNDLPDGAGIFTTGYDANLQQLDEAYRKNIPVIERPCLSMRTLRQQLLAIDTVKFQTVFLLDEGHIIHECYKSALPHDTIIANELNFSNQIRTNFAGKPLYLLVYPAFRVKDAERVIDFLTVNFPHPENNYEAYKTTRCLWTKQGLLEEIEEKIKTLNLNHVWVICSSERDRSAKSVLNEIKDAGAHTVIIKTPADLPDTIDDSMRIGVLRTPIPQSREVQCIITAIQERFCVKTA